MKSHTPIRADFTCFVPKRVRYHEVDIQNIVFNGNYLTYADIAVTEYFRECGAMGDGEAVGFFGPDGDVMVRHSALDFRGSARADDMLDMGTRVRKLGNSSFILEVAIFRNAELLTVITTTYVHFLKTSGRPAPLPQSFRDLVTGYETVAPEAA